MNKVQLGWVLGAKGGGTPTSLGFFPSRGSTMHFFKQFASTNGTLLQDGFKRGTPNLPSFIKVTNFGSMAERGACHLPDAMTNLGDDRTLTKILSGKHHFLSVWELRSHAGIG